MKSVNVLPGLKGLELDYVEVYFIGELLAFLRSRSSCSPDDIMPLDSLSIHDQGDTSTKRVPHRLKNGLKFPESTEVGEVMKVFLTLDGRAQEPERWFEVKPKFFIYLI
jgi:hypothetical protein